MRSGLRRLAAGLLCSLMAGAPAWAALFDHSAYDAILRHYVDSDGYVDYAGIRENSASALDSYLGQLGEADLAGWPQDERLAFWINAYNARVLQLVAAQPKINDASEISDLLDRRFKVAGRRLTPNDILHRILRGRINPDDRGGPIDGLTMAKPDPKALFALAPGAVGGPRLRNLAYTAENVHRLLSEDASAFVNDPKNVDLRDGRLHLSRFFRWYKHDFQEAGGVPTFIKSMLNADQRIDDDALETQLDAGYGRAVFVYDWTLNDVRNKKPLRETSDEDAHEMAEPSAPAGTGTAGAAATPEASTQTPHPSAPLNPSAADLENP